MVAAATSLRRSRGPGYWSSSLIGAIGDMAADLVAKTERWTAKYGATITMRRRLTQIDAP
jgi:hypothetical protein